MRRGRRGRAASWVQVAAGREYIVSKKLRAAASDGTYEEVFQLVQGGANVTVSDTKGRTALHFAACRGDANMVKLLISYGASVNQKDSNGNTPLHLACCTHHFGVVTALLKAGTDVNTADMRGMTPLHLAQSRLKLAASLEPGGSGGGGQGCVSRRKEMELVVDMVSAYLSLTHSSEDESKQLETLAKKLSLSETPKQVDEVQHLLESFTSLSIEKRKT